MRRRDFIAGLGGAAAWPLAAHAQQREQMRRIGVLMEADENDLAVRPWVSALTQGLAELGWIEGRNMRIDVRWAGDNVDRMRLFAKELTDLRSDVIVTNSFPTTRVLQQQTKTIPIIFIGGSDPVAAGLVGSISHPDGNTTGFPALFPSLGSKWLELLKEAVPSMARVALIFNPELYGGSYSASIEAAAAQYGVTPIWTPVHNPVEIERALEAFAAKPNGGVIVVPPRLTSPDNELINRLAVHYRLPTMFAIGAGASTPRAV